MKRIFLILPLLLLVACASNQKVHRGVVAMKIDESTAHVGLNQDEVALNDHVELYSNKCTRSVTKEVSCQKVEKGHGTVSSVINKDYVVVKFSDGVSFQEGDVVEKHEH